MRNSCAIGIAPIGLRIWTCCRERMNALGTPINVRTHERRARFSDRHRRHPAAARTRAVGCRRAGIADCRPCRAAAGAAHVHGARQGRVGVAGAARFAAGAGARRGGGVPAGARGVGHGGAGGVPPAAARRGAALVARRAPAGRPACLATAVARRIGVDRRQRSDAALSAGRVHRAADAGIHDFAPVRRRCPRLAARDAAAAPCRCGAALPSRRRRRTRCAVADRAARHTGRARRGAQWRALDRYRDADAPLAVPPWRRPASGLGRWQRAPAAAAHLLARRGRAICSSAPERHARSACRALSAASISVRLRASTAGLTPRRRPSP